MDFDAFFFDLDGTLYTYCEGLSDAIGDRLNDYVVKTAGVSPEEAPLLRDRLFHQYGGTLPGLALEYDSDYFDSLYYCHDVNVEQWITPNLDLHDVLSRASVRKIILTNSYRRYTLRVMRALGIDDCFEMIVDAIDLFPKPKPAPESYIKAMHMAGLKDPSRCAFFDDVPGNVASAKEQGFFAVQVSSRYPLSEKADAFIEKAEDMIRIPEFRSLFS